MQTDIPCYDAANNVALGSPCTDLLPYDLTRRRQRFTLSRAHRRERTVALRCRTRLPKETGRSISDCEATSTTGSRSHREAEPRLGVAYNIKRTNTVLRVSYARVMETPFNENLVLASLGCGDAVLNPLLGCAASGITPFSPGWRNEFHAGIQQAFGQYLVFSGEYIWKYTHNAYDFSILGATPITFPIEWHNSKIPGFAGRVSVPNLHGFSALMVFSSVAARFFAPQLGGAGATAVGAGRSFSYRPRREVQHDKHIQYQPWKRGPWLGIQLAI